MSTFSATCNRLSQFIKENNKGKSLSSSTTALELGGLGVATRQPPVTKNLLQCLDALSVDDRSVARLFPQQAEVIKGAQQLTIFYGGKLLVFDDFPADKAKVLMDMAGTTTTAAAPPSITPATSIAVVGVRPPAGELALAGRRSLRRFFEKRKDRIKSNAPYLLDGSPSLPNKAEASKSQHSQPQPWLGLGQQHQAALSRDMKR